MQNEVAALNRSGQLSLTLALGALKSLATGTLHGRSVDLATSSINHKNR